MRPSAARVGREVRAARDVVILAIVWDGPIIGSDIEAEYEHVMHEQLGRGTVYKNLKRLMANGLIRYASSGRDVIHEKELDQKGYVLTPKGQQVLGSFRRVLLAGT